MAADICVKRRQSRNDIIPSEYSVFIAIRRSRALDPMLRGNRYIVVAAFGWLALCGANLPSKQAKGAASHSQVALTAAPNSAPDSANATNEPVHFTAYPEYQSERCYKAKLHDSADLCAQWRAAVAAEKAAKEARRATTWSVVATFLNGLGLLAVGYALYLTIQANGIARKSAEQQLRAYLTVEPGGINQSVNNLARAPLLIKNCGQTPANSVMVFSKFGLSEDPVSFDPKSDEKKGITGERNDATFGPGVERWVFPYASNEFIEPYMRGIAERKLAVVHWGYVAYRDAFDVWRETHFAFYHWGDELSDKGSLRCRFGNSAT